jgi:hypothetical protein
VKLVHRPRAYGRRWVTTSTLLPSGSSAYAAR